MPKGVKKIRVVNGKEKSDTGFKNTADTIEINGNTTVYFEISEWLPDTPAQSKTGDVFWLLQNVKNTSRTLNQPPARKNAQKPYGITIPKKLCGVTKYYIEASLSGYQDYSRVAGIYFTGYAMPAVTRYGWCLTKEGKPSADSIFQFAQGMYLWLDTEGIDGTSHFVVDVYEGPKKENNGRIDRFNFTVTSGESLTWVDVSRWVMKSKQAPGTLITFYLYPGFDTGKDLFSISDKPLLLKVHKNIKIVPPYTKPTNRTATTVDKPNTHPGDNEPCRFSRLVVFENDRAVEIFNEGNLKALLSDKDRFITLQDIYYKYDEYELRSDSYKILDKVVGWLQESPYIPVEIGGHTDIQGNDAYNQTLSEKRAQSAVDYLVSQGVAQERISARGYGKTMLAYTDVETFKKEKKPLGTPQEILEQMHQENRRTTLRFEIYGNNALPLILETIAPSSSQPKQYEIKVEGRDTTQCGKSKDKHSIKKTIRENTSLNLNKVTTQDTDLIKYPVFSYTGSAEGLAQYYMSYLTTYLNPADTSLINNFYFYINTCAYYSDKTRPTIHLKVYPDLVWIGHFQFNFYERGKNETKGAKKNYFFGNKTVKLTNGLDDIWTEISSTTYYKVMRHIPSVWITEKTLYQYILNQAQDFDYGMHLIHERKAENAGEQLSLEGKEIDLIAKNTSAKYLPGGVVLYFVVAGIAIDLILIWLTRGRNLPAKAAKLGRRINHAKKFMDDNNIELIPPSIAVNSGMYYYMNSSRKMSLVYEANIKAEPLVEVNFTQDFDLINGFLKGNSDPKAQKVADQLQENGVFSLKGTFTVEGKIFFEENVRFHLLTQTHSFSDRLNNILQLNNRFERLIGEQIKFQVTLNGEFKELIKFGPFNTKIESQLEVKLKGGAALKLKYGTEKEKGIYVEKILVFSGIKGTFTGNIKAENDLIGERKKEIKPIPFTLIEPKEYPLYKIYLFSQNK